MALSSQDAQRFAETFAGLVGGISQALLDKEPVIRLALTTMFAGGHLLLEDAPGTGKTALARAIAATIAGTHSRIQFTPDMLPADITGVNVYDQKNNEWHFRSGRCAQCGGSSSPRPSEAASLEPRNFGRLPDS